MNNTQRAHVVRMITDILQGGGTPKQQAMAILDLDELAVLHPDQTLPRSYPSGWPLNAERLKALGWCRVLREVKP